MNNSWKKIASFLQGAALLLVVCGAFVGTIWWCCSPDFSKGECLIDKDAEKWESIPIKTVEDIGSRRYLVSFIEDGKKVYLKAEFSGFGNVERWYHKIECPK